MQRQVAEACGLESVTSMPREQIARRLADVAVGNGNEDVRKHVEADVVETVAQRRATHGGQVRQEAARRPEQRCRVETDPNVRPSGLPRLLARGRRALHDGLEDSRVRTVEQRVSRNIRLLGNLNGCGQVAIAPDDIADEPRVTVDVSSGGTVLHNEVETTTGAEKLVGVGGMDDVGAVRPGLVTEPGVGAHQQPVGCLSVDPIEGGDDAIGVVRVARHQSTCVGACCATGIDSELHHEVLPSGPDEGWPDGQSMSPLFSLETKRTIQRCSASSTAHQ